MPERGFYRHYKHDPCGAPYNYMYEVTGIARHTEDKSLMVLYRPLYASDFMPPADYQARPLSMFAEIVEKDGVPCPRFTRITDDALIEQLSQKRREMYGT